MLGPRDAGLTQRCRWVPRQSAFVVALCGVKAPPRSLVPAPGRSEGQAEEGDARTAVQVQDLSIYLYVCMYLYLDLY